MFLLDTNVVSALRRPDKAPAQVVRWAQAMDAEDFYLSAISILEIEIGIAARARTDAKQAQILRAWLEGDLLERFEDRILPVDTAVARRCGPLHVPDRRPERDALIAATALVHGLSVVTRNTADFEGTGAALVNPWAFEGG
jgi:predicted nucleic acid-binding protein